jgi:hypothetical protein
MRAVFSLRGHGVDKIAKNGSVWMTQAKTKKQLASSLHPRAQKY